MYGLNSSCLFGGKFVCGSTAKENDETQKCMPFLRFQFRYHLFLLKVLQAQFKHFGELQLKIFGMFEGSGKGVKGGGFMFFIALFMIFVLFPSLRFLPNVESACNLI